LTLITELSNAIAASTADEDKNSVVYCSESRCSKRFPHEHVGKRFDVASMTF
jgi:hypothetical protein